MIDILKEAAYEGGKVLKSYFRKTNLDIQQKKNVHDIVTIADKTAQDVIVKYISSHLPKDTNFGFIGEEQLSSHTDASDLFIIDPLDGTSSYAAGLDYFCVSIGYAKNKEIMAGVIYDPIRDILYSAVKGEGAYKNNEKMQITTTIDPKRASIFLTTSSNPAQRANYVHLMEKIHESVRCYRLLGSVALDICHVASGVGDLALNTGCNIWDIAAATIIMQEAGGEALFLDGKPLKVNFDNTAMRYSVIAGEKNLTDYIYSQLQTAEK